jgi:hypothetical protein
MLTLPTRQLLLGYETRNKYKMVSNSIIEAGVATFLVIFVSILFIIKVKMILMLVK